MFHNNNGTQLICKYNLIDLDSGSSSIHCIFKVTQGDYSKFANGEERFKEAAAEGGWSSILAEIKNLVE